MQVEKNTTSNCPLFYLIYFTKGFSPHIIGENNAPTRVKFPLNDDLSPHTFASINLSDASWGSFTTYFLQAYLKDIS